MTEPSTTYEGGCHCGRIRFRVRVREHVGVECNCSICQMKGFLHLIVPPEDFHLIRGAEHLQTYRFNTRTAKHTFCRVCAIHPFYTPRSHPDHVDVNVRCLDEDAVRHFSFEPFDGQNWEANVHQIR